jgi:hypothetical protein
MARMATGNAVIIYSFIFSAQLLKLQKSDSSLSLTKIADKLFVLDSWILFTISLTALICSSKYRKNLTNIELHYLLTQ